MLASWASLPVCWEYLQVDDRTNSHSDAQSKIPVDLSFLIQGSHLVLLTQGGCIKGSTFHCHTQQLSQCKDTILISYLHLGNSR